MGGLRSQGGDSDWILLESVRTADAFGESTWQGKLLHAILRVFGGEELVLALRNILKTWVLLEQLRDRISYHGMYEILDYQSTLDIQGATGERATITRREVIRSYNTTWVPSIITREETASFLRSTTANREYRWTSMKMGQRSTVNACAVCCSLPHKSPLLLPPFSTGRPNMGRMSAEKGPYARQSASRPTAARFPPPIRGHPGGAP